MRAQERGPLSEERTDLTCAFASVCPPSSVRYAYDTHPTERARTHVPPLRRALERAIRLVPIRARILERGGVACRVLVCGETVA